jgi:hypothetical protein
MAEFLKLILLVVFMQQDGNGKNKEKAVFQDDSAAIQTAGNDQSWFEEHEGERQHLPWPAQ